MKKLRLTLNDLRVESYATADHAAANPGTVKAHADASAVHTCFCPATDHRTCGCTEYRTCGCTEHRTCACPQTDGYTCYNTCYCYTWSGAECNTVCIG